MQNTNKVLHWAFAGLAFIVSLATYLMTVQPTVPFWDCGEFTAAAVNQQVPHPPGAPLFLMLGKLFNLLPFGDPGWRVNLLSVFASAATVMILYFITVKVIRNFYREDLSSLPNALAVYGAGLVAALTFTFSDTFWFNAVESEVYAASQLFVSIIVLLMMIWNEKADEAGHERYLLLIAYLIGLAIGVHLLSILTLFSITLLVYLRKYKYSHKGLVVTGVIGVVAFWVIYSLIIMKMPGLLAGNFWKDTAAKEYAITDSPVVTLFGIALLAAAVYGVYYGRKTSHGVLSLCCSAFLLIVVGYTTYGHIIVRANSNTPMNENKPDNLSKLVSYLGREQYGDAPTWPRRYQTEERFIKHYREYGTWTAPGYKRIDRSDGTSISLPDFKKINTSAELKYMWGYQVDHMYLRYFLWNFMGRSSDVQDAPAYGPMTKKAVVAAFNHKNGYASLFPVNFYALPLILGLIGLFFHFYADKKMASIYLVLFLMTGVLAAVSQNQQNPQPRERDYFYIGSFMVWAMWAGMGAFAIIQWLPKLKSNIGGVGLVLAAALIAVPYNMGSQGWKMHSRAGNYLAFDYAYNILQSVEKDAIIFTNGDNDTFPVWYLQDVAGVRRDVRVVNLSLGQTLWYIEQLKNRSPYGALKIPLSFTDKQLTSEEDSPNALSYTLGPTVDASIQVSPDILRQFTTDPAVINSGVMKWTYKGRQIGAREGEPPQYFFGVQHKLVYDILRQTGFKRPVYFSTSVGDPSWADEYIGLDNYLRLEGMAYRVCPAPQRSAIGETINEKVMDKALMQPRNGADFDTQPTFGMKFRGLNDPNVYYDDVHRGYLMNYRNIYIKYANYLLYEKQDTAKAINVMNEMNKTISLTQFPLPLMLEYNLTRFFASVNATKETEEMAMHVVTSAEALIQNPALRSMEQGLDRQPLEIIAAEAATYGGLWAKAEQFYRSFDAQGGDLIIKGRIDLLAVAKKERARDFEGALKEALALQAKYSTATGQDGQQVNEDIARKIMELQRKLGRTPEVPMVTMAPIK